ncbi:hypothetical protein [Sporosarcina sp. FSL K6-3457]|uniref:hypothetical protein n=1 Tax=Sporosarcina sp. FSL K6-3457 TaxID=2978204 RepID=UPI0030FD0EA3
MVVDDMLVLTNRFKEINESKSTEHIKSARLANLMTDMEQIYRIPMFRDEDYNAKNPHVMQLYWAVSEARAL